MNTRRMMLRVAVAASLATTAAALTPAVVQASAPRGSGAPAVTYYAGTRGVARLLPRTAPSGGAPAATLLRPRGARRLPSGAFSAREAVPAVQASAAGAATSSTLVNVNG